jgi:hypothetical protein
VVYLIDDRFTRPEVKDLLPGWWKVKHLRVRRKATTGNTVRTI